MPRYTVDYIQPSMLGNCVAASIPSALYSQTRHVYFLPDRLLKGPVGIVECWLTVNGYASTGGGSFFVNLDKDKNYINESRYPLSQNGDFGQYQMLSLCHMYTVQPGGMTMSRDTFDHHPISYTPGKDAFITTMDGSNATGPFSPNWNVSFITDCEINLVPKCNADLPAPTDQGNDWATRLMLHARGANGTPTFQDHSWRNYTVRQHGGGTIHVDGYYYFPGNGSIMSVDQFPPGYGDGNWVTRMDWDMRADDFTVDFIAKPITIGTNAANPCCLMSMAGGYSPLVVFAFSGRYWLCSSSNGSSWNIAANVDMGPAPLNTDTHLAVVRDGGNLLLFNNGNLITTIAIGTTSFAYPYSGRPVFGGSVTVNNYGTQGAGAYPFNGYLREIRWSKGVARWTSAFTARDCDYAP